MSFITTPEATPARILGAFRYLVEYGPMAADELAARIWPAGNRSGDFFAKVQSEMLGIGLVVESQGKLHVGERVPKGLTASSAEAALPVWLGRELLKKSSSSTDLAYGIAWLMSLDPLVDLCQQELAVRELSGGELRGLARVTSDASYGQFEDWVPYLGFGWIAPPLVGQAVALVPDPTVFVRRSLAELLPEVDVWVPIAELRRRLAGLASVFEGGEIRNEVHQILDLESSEPAIAPTTTLAIRRLVDEGMLETRALSDANVHMLAFGDSPRVAEVRRCNTGKN